MTKSPSNPPVVLVLGNDAFSTRVAELARDAGNTVVLARPEPKDLDQIRTLPLDPASHASLLSAWQTSIKEFGHITAVLAAFAPQPTAPGAIPGADQTALRTALDPSVRLTKIALYHARRQTEQLESVAWLAISGGEGDIMAATSAGAITGMFRSMIARFSAHGVHTSLVTSSSPDDATAAALVACVRPQDSPARTDSSSSPFTPVLPKRLRAKMHVVRGGDVETIHALQGIPYGFQYAHIFTRFAGLTVFSEDVARWKLGGGPKRALAYLGLAAALLAASQFGVLARLAALIR